MDKEMTQMNIRIPVSLKRGGDQVIARHGRTPSDVVREVWVYIDQTQQLPECVCGHRLGARVGTGKEGVDGLKATNAKADSPVRKAETLLEDFFASTGLTRESFSQSVQVPYEESFDDVYEQLLDEYLALEDEEGGKVNGSAFGGGQDASDGGFEEAKTFA